MRRRFGSKPERLPLPSTPVMTASTDRTLFVGRGIILAGAIKDCDRLVVEGKVDAEVTCKELKIVPGGLFMGTAAVVNAEVSGRLEGQLTVTERLVVRATGIVSGDVCYREIEIERGGRMSGHIQAGGVLEPVKTIAPVQRRSA
jgi:cytoskeletal protein CcmA (bactofilin family)